MDTASARERGRAGQDSLGVGVDRAERRLRESARGDGSQGCLPLSSFASLLGRLHQGAALREWYLVQDLDGSTEHRIVAGGQFAGLRLDDLIGDDADAIEWF